jgi:hypothetical protein
MVVWKLNNDNLIEFDSLLLIKLPVGWPVGFREGCELG